MVYQEFYHGCENSVYPEATRGKLQIFTTVVKSGIPRLAVVELIYLIARRKAFSWYIRWKTVVYEMFFVVYEMKNVVYE